MHDLATSVRSVTSLIDRPRSRPSRPGHPQVGCQEVLTLRLGYAGLGMRPASDAAFDSEWMGRVHLASAHDEF